MLVVKLDSEVYTFVKSLYTIGKFYSNLDYYIAFLCFFSSGHSQSGGMPSYSSNAPSGDLMYYPDQRSSHPANRSRHHHHPGASTHLSDVSYPISSQNRTHMFSARQQQQPQASQSMSFGNVSKYHIKNIGIDIGHTNYNSGLGKHHENIILNSRRELQIGLKTRHSQLLKQAGDLSHKPEIKEDLKAHLISTLHRGIDTTLLVRTILIDRNLHVFII